MFTIKVGIHINDEPEVNMSQVDNKNQDEKLKKQLVQSKTIDDAGHESDKEDTQHKVDIEEQDVDWDDFDYLGETPYPRWG
jgi:hypothetical protein